MSDGFGYGIKFINQGGRKSMKINTLLEDIRKERQAINDNAKYYNRQWKIDKLKELKVKTLKAYQEAIEEVESVNLEYEKKIKEIENSPSPGHSANSEYLDNVRFTKSRLLADIQINPYQKDAIIQRALSSRMGSQALLELIQNKEIDNSYWTDEVFKSAYISSKTQKELDWELNKASQIEAILKEQSDRYNYGSYLAAKKTFDGDVKSEYPTLERQYDIEIEALEKEE